MNEIPEESIRLINEWAVASN